MQQAWGPASNMAKNVNTQQDAMNILQQAGINSTILAKVKGALNNPMATVPFQVVQVYCQLILLMDPIL